MIFALAWITIGLISAIDIYWAIKNQNILLDAELNPVGKYLIQADHGSVALFMGVKVTGLVLVLGFLIVLRKFFPFLAMFPILSLLLAQFVLLWFLYS